MDDIKLYAKSKWDIDPLIHLTQFQEDIWMSFKLEKCGLMVVKRGKVVKINGMQLPAGHMAKIQMRNLRLPGLW